MQVCKAHVSVVIVIFSKRFSCSEIMLNGKTCQFFSKWQLPSLSPLSIILPQF